MGFIFTLTETCPTLSGYIVFFLSHMNCSITVKQDSTHRWMKSNIIAQNEWDWSKLSRCTRVQPFIYVLKSDTNHVDFRSVRFRATSHLRNLASGGSQFWCIGCKITLAKLQSQSFTPTFAIKVLHTLRKKKKKQQQVEQKKWTTNTKPLQQRKAGFVQSELTLWGVGGVTVRLRVHYLFGRLLLFHTVPNYNIHYFPAKPLHYAFKATLFSCKKNK